MSLNSISKSLILYTPPKTAMEFIKTEIERNQKNNTNTWEQSHNVLSFDPTQVMRYGLFGQETVKKMANALESHSLQIIYNSKTKKFTVLESSNIDRKAIEIILAVNRYRGWHPKVLDEVDQSGNRLVQLEAIVTGIEIEAISTEITPLSTKNIKPIQANNECGPCGLCGYDPFNKIAFIDFNKAGEVMKSSGLFFYNIAKLVKEKIQSKFI